MFIIFLIKKEYWRNEKIVYDPCAGQRRLRDSFFFSLRVAFLGGGNVTCACVFRLRNHLTFEGDGGRGWVIFKLEKMSCKQTRNEKNIYYMESILLSFKPKKSGKNRFDHKRRLEKCSCPCRLPTTPSKVKVVDS